MRCAVFRGGFSLEAIEALLSQDEGAPAVERLGSLRDKSLLVSYEPGGRPGAVRYGLL